MSGVRPAVPAAGIRTSTGAAPGYLWSGRPITVTRVRRGLSRRGRVVARRIGAPAQKPRQKISRVRQRAVHNRAFVRRVGSRARPPAYWDDFAEQLTEAWYDGGRRALLVRAGVHSWRRLPGVHAVEALDVGFRSLGDGDLEWAEVIAEGFIAIQPGHRRGHKLKAMVLAARGEWRPAQDHWRIGLGGNRHRAAARRWVINERGRAEARRLIKLMPEPESIIGADGTTLADLLAIRPDRSRDFNDQLGALLIQQVTRGQSPQLRPLLQAWAATQQRERIVLAPGEVARSVRSINVDRFRAYVSGRRVALIANSPSLLGSGLGPTIDDYDLVVRFNSFALHPDDTGSRTDVHVAFHKYDFNLELPVDVRILLSAREPLWRESLKLRIRPGAQRWLGDGTLRWPAVTEGLIGPDEDFKLPTAGFNILRLLLHFNVCQAVDLFGFDFYETGMHRLAGAATIPHSPGHNSNAEKEWVMAHAAATTDKIISMVPTPC